MAYDVLLMLQHYVFYRDDGQTMKEKDLLLQSRQEPLYKSFEGLHETTRTDKIGLSSIDIKDYPLTP